MRVRQLLIMSALVLSLAPAPGGAAPQGKVVIAQGVDPTTLDTMNQQETPASVVAGHIFDTLVHRINKLWIDEMPAAPLYQQLDLYGASKRLTWKARSDELIKVYDMALKEGN